MNGGWRPIWAATGRMKNRSGRAARNALRAEKLGMEGPKGISASESRDHDPAMCHALILT